MNKDQIHLIVTAIDTLAMNCAQEMYWSGEGNASEADKARSRAESIKESLENLLWLTFGEEV